MGYWFTRCHVRNERRGSGRVVAARLTMSNVEIAEDEASANMAMISNEVRDPARVYVAAC